MDAVRRHSQSTWPVSMRPLHAGTQEKMVTREKSKKQHKHTKETNCGREKHRHGPRAGRQPHTSPHTNTPSQCCQSAGKRIRPSTKRRHTPPAVTHQWTRRRSDSSSIHDAATTFPAIPPTMEFNARLKAVIGGASRLQEK
ncbi:hypothetical protein TcCL_NonESM11803 [Trypanosoma cruzi]|nr:hypothetical protein TcCL_NonESM11803 [Trypanosoma cruzi]